jgi:glycosyltransferase involved in cell wall biosynthesis
VLVVPESLDSRDMFVENEFDVVYLKIRRPRRTRNLWTHMTYFLSFPLTLFALRRIIREKDTQLVHFNEITDFIAGLAAKLCAVPSVCHVRADSPPNPYRWLLLSTLERTVDAIIVPSKSTEDWIASGARKLAGRIKLIYDHAFDVSDYQPSVSGAGFREELGVPPEAILVLLVSKLVAHKGHKCFIRAAAKVMKTSKNIQFVIVGGPVAGREEEASDIRALAEELTPEPSLRLVSPRSDLAPIYAAADIAVHCPVFPDTYPTVVLLAMVAGKPVIGSNIGGIPEQIEHDKTGLLVPPDDPEELAGTILRLAADGAKRKMLGSAARKAVTTDFAPDRQAQLLAELYATVIHRWSMDRNGDS